MITDDYGDLVTTPSATIRERLHPICVGCTVADLAMSAVSALILINWNSRLAPKNSWLVCKYFCKSVQIRPRPYSLVERMAHVQRAGHIRRWQLDGE